MSPELQPEEISRLIADSLAGELSAEDSEALRRWVALSPQNEQLLESLSSMDRAMESAQQLINYDADHAWQRVMQHLRRRRWQRVVLPVGAAVAAVALLVGLFSPDETLPEPAPSASIASIEEQTAVRLVRSSGEVVLVDSVHRIDLADAVVRGDAEGMTVVPREEFRSAVVAYNTIRVPLRKHFDVTLSDGTRVTLNAGSSLRFPERFPEGKPREVFLEGEAYFSVSKDRACPFVVHAGAEYVRVTGTEFCVTHFEDQPALITTLVEGRVSVGRTGTNFETTLLPGMQAEQNRQSGLTTTRAVDVSEYTAWREGLFAFRRQPLGKIMASVGRWYGCRIVFENPQLAEVRYTGRIARSASLEEVASFFSNTREVDILCRDGELVIR